MQQTTDIKQPDMKLENFERSLLVPITEKERRELSDRTAYLLAEIDNMTEEQKAAAKQAKAQIDERKAELRRVSNEYRDGQKYAKVKCERRFLYRVGNYQEIRTDTGEVLLERPLTEREKQLGLPGVEGGKAEAKADDGIVDDDYKPEGAEPLATEKGKKGGRGKKGKG